MREVMKTLVSVVISLFVLFMLSGCNNSSKNTTANSVVKVQLSADPGVNEIQLSWNQIDDSTGYLLEWSDIEDVFDNSLSFSDTQTVFLHEDLEPSHTYYYRLTVQFIDSNNNISSEVLTVITGNLEQIRQIDTGPSIR